MPPPDNERGRPLARKAAPATSTPIKIPSSVPTDGTAVAHAELALRCAWLRHHARVLRGIDPTGLLSAQLLDFADLLEVAEREGWWTR